MIRSILTEKRYLITIAILIILWLLGIFLGLKFHLPPSNHFNDFFYKKSQTSLIVHTFPFFRIFTNNLLVGSVLSIAGFFSCGLISVYVLFINGFNFGLLISALLHVGQNTTLIVERFVYHGCIEVIALCMFTEIGLQGFVFLKKSVFEKKIVSFNIKILFLKFASATALLTIAALIEAFLFFYPSIIDIK